MQAVFLKNKSDEIIHPIQESENLEDDIFGVGMYQHFEADHTIKIPQHLRIGKEETFLIAFVADQKEGIEFILEQPYSFRSEKRDERVYFLPEKFDRNLVGKTEFLYTKENEIYKITLSILPMMDEQVYGQIKKDLTSISIRLFYKSKEDEASKRIKKEILSEYDLEIQQLEKSIKELEHSLYALNQDPVMDLTCTFDRQSFRKIKHLDVNGIMDHYVLQKPKVRTRVHKKTFNIYENQKIYSFLKLLEKRLQELKIEIAEKQETFNQIEQEGLKKKSFDSLFQTITKLEKKIKKVYQLKIFQNEKMEVHSVYPLKTSNLFVNHKKYRKVFQIMSAYKEVGSLLEQNRIEYKSIHKSSELYEIWCYFKILEILILEKEYQIDKISWPGKINEPFVFEDWHKTDIHKLLRKISNYIENNEKKDSIKSLEELVIHLVNGEKDIYLGYNCTFRARYTAQSRFHKVSNRLRPDIFLLLNKEIFFSCDAKYKDYRKQGMGLQAWYTDLFECAAYKYLYRLDLGNEENLCESPLSVKERFTEADMRMNVLKNGGSCILSPAMADCDRPSKYNGYQIEEQYKTFLKYLEEGKVNRDLFGQEKLEPEEYTIHLQNEISTKDYEYHVASIRFLPNDYRGFFFLFLEALKYEQAHFLEEMW